MDPNACLARILESLEDLRDGNEDARDDAVEALRDLAEWLARGGFPPRATYVLSD